MLLADMLYICSSYQWREGGWTRGHWYRWAWREAKIEGIDISGEGRIGRKAQDACAERDRARIRFLVLSPYSSFWFHSADAGELWKSPRSFIHRIDVLTFDDCRVDHCCNDKTTIYGTKETSALKSRQNEMKSNEPPVNLPAIYIFLPRVRTRTANSVRVYVGRVNETPTKSYISRVNLRRTPLCSSLLSWSCRTSGSRVSLSLCGETNDTLETVVNASIYTEATARETSTSLFRIFHRE